MMEYLEMFKDPMIICLLFIGSFAALMIVAGLNGLADMSAAADAANRRMLSAGRTVWNDDDWNAMCAEFERLKPRSKVSDPRSAQDQYFDSID